METQQLPLLFCGLTNQPTSRTLIRKDWPPINKEIGNKMGQFTDLPAAGKDPGNTWT